MQQDVRVVSNARLEMAIANFWHSENLPNKADESPRFASILKLAKWVDSLFKIPGQKKITGDLLDLNYNNCMNVNKEMILRDAAIYGLCWLSTLGSYFSFPLPLRL